MGRATEGWGKYLPENHIAEPPVLVDRIALMETDNSRSRDQASNHVSWRTTDTNAVTVAIVADYNPHLGCEELSVLFKPIPWWVVVVSFSWPFVCKAASIRDTPSTIQSKKSS